MNDAHKAYLDEIDRAADIERKIQALKVCKIHDVREMVRQMLTKYSQPAPAK